MQLLAELSVCFVIMGIWYDYVAMGLAISIAYESIAQIFIQWEWNALNKNPDDQMLN